MSLHNKAGRGRPRRGDTLGRRRRDGMFVMVAIAVLTVWVSCALWRPAIAQTQVANTKHNLSVTGPGNVQSAQAGSTCVACHVLHDPAPMRAQWNHKTPGTTYQIYSSTSLIAKVDQPTGTSRICLSCHDGLLAVSIPGKANGNALAKLAPLTGKASLGTNLSANHPISFVYDSALAMRQGELADPKSLPSTIRLDDKHEMQCTSCHDAHEDRQAKFLRMDGRFAPLCTSCHKQHRWNGSVHATSSATWKGGGTNPLLPGAPSTVAENACMSCHRPHAAGHPERLLAQASEPGNCTSCHGGSMAQKNIEVEFMKPLRHPIETNQWVHEPRENPLAMNRHVACTDCHNAHAAVNAPGAPPAVSGRLFGVSGLSISGAPVSEAQYEYEVCSKCHGVREPTTLGLTRQSGTRNIRVKIDPANASYHPIATMGTNTSVLGLQAGYTSSSMIGCSSCHNNDDWSPSGVAPSGPHGSRFDPILQRQYLTQDPTAESAQSFDLCYQCHNRSFLINDQAHAFPHNRHVVTKQTPCAACHDAHGSRQNAHLIDFMLRDKSGKSVVTRSAVQGRLEYISTGPGRGQCYLQCHGVNHEPKSYP